MIGGTNKGKDRTGQDTERERWRWRRRRRWRRDGADKERQRTKRAPARGFIDSQDSTAKRSKGHPFAAALLKGTVWKLDGGWRPILVKQMLRRTSYLLGGGAAQMTRAGPAEEREEGASGVTGAKPLVSGALWGGTKALRRDFAASNSSAESCV